MVFHRENPHLKWMRTGGNFMEPPNVMDRCTRTWDFVVSSGLGHGRFSSSPRNPGQWRSGAKCIEALLKWLTSGDWRILKIQNWNRNSQVVENVNLNVQTYPKHKNLHLTIQESCWATFEAVFGAPGMALLVDIATLVQKKWVFNGFYHQCVAIWGGKMMITRGVFLGGTPLRKPFAHDLNCWFKVLKGC